jgi:type I toxin-antitoxin system toxin SymE
MRSRRLDKLGELPALARARQRRAPVNTPPAAPALPAVVTPEWGRSQAAPPAPAPRRSRTPVSLTIGSRFTGLMVPGRSCSIVPYLRISGRWLEENGFTIGSSVAVDVAGGRLVLTNAATVDAENEDRVTRFERLHA